MLDLNNLLSYNITKLLDYIRTCDLETKKIILSNEKIIDKFVDYSATNSFYFTNCIEFMLENSYFKNLILDDNYDISNLIFKGINFGDTFLQDKRFIEKLVNELDVSKYRFMMNELEKNNNSVYLEPIEQKRKQYYDDIIDNYDENLGMFKKYVDIFNNLVVDDRLVDQQILFDLDLNSKLPNGINYDINIIFFNRDMKPLDQIKRLEDLLKKATCLDFREILVDRYYEDIPYNFQLDLDVLIKFNKEANAINNKKMEHYLKLFKILNNKNIVDIDFYNSFDKNKNYVADYYDDFSISKRKSYGSINDSLVDCDEIENQQNKELSSLYGINIYEFKGEEFYLLIHNTSYVKSNVENVDNIFENYSKRDGTSMSLISNLKMNFFNNYEDMLVLGFNNLDVDSFVHIYNKDSYSNYEKQIGIASDKQNKLYTPALLIDDTIGYNEIVYQIKTKNTKYMTKTLKPSYVVVFDEITPVDIEMAKKFAIPVIRIDRKKYMNYNCGTSENLGIDDRYVSSYAALRNKRK